MSFGSFLGACIGIRSPYRPTSYSDIDVCASSFANARFCAAKPLANLGPEAAQVLHTRSETARELVSRGLLERVVPADGNGLFYAVLDQMEQHQIPLSDGVIPSLERREEQAKKLRDDTIDFVKSRRASIPFAEYGTCEKNAQTVAQQGKCSKDEDLTIEALSCMLNLNLVVVRKGSGCYVNTSAHLRNDPKLVIVLNENLKNVHFNSTEPLFPRIASAEKSGTKKPEATVPLINAASESANDRKTPDQPQDAGRSTVTGPFDRMRYEEVLTRWEMVKSA